MRELSTGTVKNVLVLLLTIVGLGRGQVGTLAPVVAGSSGGDAAFAAMQESIERQQAALDALRDTIQTTALAQQHESVLKQVEPLKPRAGAQAGAVSSTTPLAAAVSADATKFFSVPWPGSLPLAMPNVQIASDSCEALAKPEVEKLVESAAGKHGLSPDLLRSVMKQESAFKPCALSTAGAMGLMQIMPETAGMLRLEDPFDPASNVDAGAKFLKMMLDRFGGDLPLALAAYNAGPGAVDKAGGVPPIAETLKYLTNILGDLPAAY